MKKPPAKILAVMKEAAELRAIGLSWEIIAVKLGRDERTLRRWTERYRMWWHRMLFRAERDALRHVGNKSLSILDRSQMGKGDPNSTRAAQFLYSKQCDMKAGWRRRQRASAIPAYVNKYLPLLSYYESLNESQRQAYFRHLLAQFGVEPVPAAVPDSGGPGQPVAG